MKQLPLVVIFRLAEYHCLLSEMLKNTSVKKLTSKEIASHLGFTEEIVRKDLSFIPYEIGTPGLGYDPVKLYKAISKMLHIDKINEVALVGSISTWKGLFNFFDPRKFGFQFNILFSEIPSEKGSYFDQAPVYQIEDIPKKLPDNGIRSCIIACDSAWVKRAAELCVKNGVKGILNLTPTVLENLPEDVYISQVLLSCEIKLLMYHLEEDRVNESDQKLKRDIAKRARLKRNRSGKNN